MDALGSLELAPDGLEVDDDAPSGREEQRAEREHGERHHFGARARAELPLMATLTAGGANESHRSKGERGER